MTEATFSIPFPPVQHGYTEQEIDAVVQVMREAGPAGDRLSQGKHLVEFEKAFAHYVGAKHAFAVDNGTNALNLAAVLSRVGPGDDVIIPAYTYCASAIPFAARGANIIWADIDPQSWDISIADIERKLTPRTRVIVCVHLLGMPCDMPAIMNLAHRHGLLVVEDCAQAIGATINGKVVGSFGDFGCFSFHSQKAFSTLGEGGMLTLSSASDAEMVVSLRFNGVCSFDCPQERYWVPAMNNVDCRLPDVWPFNYCIGEAQCALGSQLLKRVDNLNEVLISQAAQIRAAIADIPELTMQDVPAGFKSVWHQCVLHYDGSAYGKNRNDLLDILTSIHSMRMNVQYPPLYRLPLFYNRGLGIANCPILENWWDNSFSMPWWNGISTDIMNKMMETLRNTVIQFRNSTEKG